jgi:hypothetical protein
MTVEHHDFEYIRGFVDDLLIASCSCGWYAKESADSLTEAQEHWEDHCEVVFMEATGG